jgi:hypothetical protein
MTHEVTPSEIYSDDELTLLGQPVTRAQLEVFAAVLSEVSYQDAQVALNHGDPAPRKSMEEFVLYMEDYLHELRSQLSRTWGPTAYDKARHTMRKVITLGVRALETHGAPHRERNATTYTGRKPE